MRRFRGQTSIRRALCALLAAAQLAGFALPTPARAAEAAVVPDGIYGIQPEHAPAMRVDKSGSDETKIQLYALQDATASHVQWRFSQASDGYYNITSTYNGSYLATDNTGADVGSKIAAKTSGRGDGALWLLEHAGNNFFYLHPKSAPELVMEAMSSATANGTVLWLAEKASEGGENQCFKLRAVSGGAEIGEYDVESGAAQGATPDELAIPDEPITLYEWHRGLPPDYYILGDGVYSFEPECAPNSRVNIQRASGNVALYKKGTDEWDRWQVTYRGDGYYNIASLYNGQKLRAESLSVGANVNMNNNDGSYEQWRFVYAGDNYFYLCNKGRPDLVLNVKDAKADDGANLQLYYNDRGSACRFHIHKVNGTLESGMVPYEQEMDMGRKTYPVLLTDGTYYAKHTGSESTNGGNNSIGWLNTGNLSALAGFDKSALDAGGACYTYDLPDDPLYMEYWDVNKGKHFRDNWNDFGHYNNYNETTHGHKTSFQGEPQYYIKWQTSSGRWLYLASHLTKSEGQEDFYNQSGAAYTLEGRTVNRAWTFFDEKRDGNYYIFYDFYATNMIPWSERRVMKNSYPNNSCTNLIWENDTHNGARTFDAQKNQAPGYDGCGNGGSRYQAYYAIERPISNLRNDFTVQGGQVANFDGVRRLADNVIVTVEDGGVLVIGSGTGVDTTSGGFSAALCINNGAIVVKEGGTLLVEENAILMRYNPQNDLADYYIRYYAEMMEKYKALGAALTPASYVASLLGENVSPYDYYKGLYDQAVAAKKDQSKLKDADSLGALICGGLLIARSGAKVTGAGSIGIRFTETGQCYNFGLLLSENFSCAKSYTIDNQASGSVVTHLSVKGNYGGFMAGGSATLGRMYTACAVSLPANAVYGDGASRVYQNGNKPAGL